jgi:hypothetical protein
MLQKIINELAIDCDKFFDEVADLNEHISDDDKGKRGKTFSQRIGLCKRLFYSHLQKYGV